MRTYNPNKKIKIEIYAPTNPVDGYTIWDISGMNRNAITRKADDSDIENILTPKEFKTLRMVNDMRLVFRLVFFL